MNTTNNQPDSALDILRKENERLAFVETYFNEWINKTEWVQNTAGPLELGLHRADVMRNRIEALHKENEDLRKEINSLLHPVAKLAEEWSEEDGDVIWHKFPIDEPPYVGSPLDLNWTDDYYTHWQPLPPIPSLF